MGTSLAKLEKRLILSVTRAARSLVGTGISAISDYKQRHLEAEAAAVSFYALFSIFPLLAFSVYLIGTMLGDPTQNQTLTGASAIALRILHDYVPAMQKWIEKGLFDAISGYTATNWVNAILLCWSGIGLFDSILGGIEALPEDPPRERRAHVTQAALGLFALVLFVTFITTVAFCEIVGSAAQTPFWLKDLPFEFQDLLYWGARTRILLGLVSIGLVMMLYKVLLPVKLSIRSAFVGSLVFTGLHLLSRSAYWIYLHYNRHDIESTFGVFSALVLIVLWVHFSVSCLLYGGLIALHLDRERDEQQRKHELREKQLHERHERHHKKAA